jgi:hypothetical protein
MPGNTVDLQPAAKNLDPISQPAQPRSAASVGSTNAVIGDLHIDPAVTRRHHNGDV